MTDTTHTLATRDCRFPYRAVIRRTGQEQAALAALAGGRAADGLLTGTAVNGLRLCMFAGQGTQRARMGQRLYETFPAFADAIDELCDALDKHLDQPLRSIMYAQPATAEAALLDRTGYAQPALFATEVALYRLLQSWGCTADLVMGHSIGELAAAHVAGVFPLADAAALVAARGRLMQSLPGGGAMVSVRATAAQVEPLLDGYRDRASIAAINGPEAVVISGAGEAVAAITAELSARGHRTVQLAVSHAFHSPLMEPILDEFRRVAAGLSYHQPNIPVLSNVTGMAAGPADLCTPDYWVTHIRQPVRFQEAVLAARAAGAAHLVEVGPDATLSAMARVALGESAGPGGQPWQVVPLLRAGRDEVDSLLDGLAAGYVRGLDLDWPSVAATLPGQVTDLPTYPFERRRYWLPPGAGGGATEPRRSEPDPGTMLEIPESGDRVWSGRLSPRRQPWLAEHVVAGEPVVPGAVLAQLVAAAGRATGHDRVDELVLVAPLPVPGTEDIDVQVLVRPAGDARATVAVHGRPVGGSWTKVAAGQLAAGGPGEPAPLVEWPPPEATPVPVEPAYPGLAEHGLRYGPSCQGLRALWRRGAEVFAEVSLPDGARTGTPGYDLHPVLLDSALHPAALLGLADSTGAPAPGLRVPFLWRGLSRYGEAGADLRVRLAPAGPDTVAVTLADGTGLPVMSIDALTLRPLASAGGAVSRLSWTQLPADLDAVPRRQIALAGDDELIRRALPAAHPTGAGRAEVVVLPCPADEEPASPAALSDRVSRTAAAIRELLEQHDRVAVVTCRALAVRDHDRTDDLPARAVWGLVRSVQAEEPGRLQLIDHDGDPASLRLLGRAIDAGLPQLALREGTEYVPELVASEAGLVPPGTGQPYRLDYAGCGAPENIRLVSAPEVAADLGTGEIRVDLYAVGVNFRDVLLTLGVVTPESGVSATAAPQAVEGAGIVRAVGAGVAGLAPGDRVMGLFGQAGPHARTDHRMIVRIPPGWSFARSAAVPVAFLTAYYGLLELAGLTEGDKVLIHTATGAVGMAAVQLCQRLGAEVFATASPAKQATLRELGIPDDHIASSRDAGFEASFRAAAPAGLDIVLNSLAGELTDASLRLLRPGGRFLEMGKTDIRDPAALGDIRYLRYDIREAGPEYIRDTLAHLVRLFEAGALVPPPVTRWPLAHAPAAYRFVAEARHVGKVVLDVRTWDPSRAVLVTGGLGTLGALVARHLVTRHGVRHLVLTGRRGAGTPGADELVDELVALGARVDAPACDVSDRESLAGLLRELRSGGVELGGVVHAAGVTQDSTLAGLTQESIGAVLGPKAEAARYLDELTRDTDLAAFVLFSSVAATLGSAGQANYAAANAVLDGLAEQRRARGLPAVSIAWGLWEPASGITARLTAGDHERLARRGVRALTAEQGLALFDAAVAGTAAVPVAARLELPAVRSTLAGESGAVPAAGPGSDGGDPLVDIIREAAAAVLGHDSMAEVPADAIFKELGLDSLGAIELRNRISAATGVTLPATLIFDYPTPRDLADHLRPEGPGGPDAPG